MDKNKRNLSRVFRNELLEAFVADVETIKEEVPWEGIQSVRASVTDDGRAIVEVSKLAVEGSVDRVCVWKGSLPSSKECSIQLSYGAAKWDSQVLSPIFIYKEFGPDYFIFSH